jgi:hypothetical protein
VRHSLLLRRRDCWRLRRNSMGRSEEFRSYRI